MADRERLAYADLVTVAGEIRAGAITAEAVTQAMIDRITAHDGRLHSVTTLFADEALAEARVADAEIAAGHWRGPLHGVPIAIKDLCFTKGVVTTSGTAVYARWTSDYDATVVTRLRAAGR